MEKIRVIGVLFMSLSILFSISNFAITGAVTGSIEIKSMEMKLLPLIFLLIGIILFSLHKTIDSSTEKIEI